MRRFILFLSGMLWFGALFAQDPASGNSPITGHQKIYVAITVLGIILLCIFIFLFSLERRLKALEHKQNS